MQETKKTESGTSGSKGLIGITMGCPVGVGPEIILRFFKANRNPGQFIPVVIGDIDHLRRCSDQLSVEIEISSWQPGEPLGTERLYVVQPGTVDGYELDSATLNWGKPDRRTGSAAAKYITKAVQLVEQGELDGIVTCPITKYGLQLAGYDFPGHTEMLASLSGTENYGMMMAGGKLRVSLVTIHVPLAHVMGQLTKKEIERIILLTAETLIKDFNIDRPKIAVAGLNPHSGEEGLFGAEEKQVIEPAVSELTSDHWDIYGPLPPDTVFKNAMDGKFDAVIAMYHDQGLIPFKLIHFDDGVNLTMGLPFVRTSVDHGTAYDIAGTGIARYSSLEAAFAMAAEVIVNRKALC